MRERFHGPPRRSWLAGFLALFLLSSPVAALKLMLTLRYPIAVAGGHWVGAKLKLQRKSSSQPLEITRPLTIRRELDARPATACEGSLRDLASRSDLARPGNSRPRGGLLDPAYLRIFLASTPQNPVFPPAEPVPLAS